MSDPYLGEIRMVGFPFAPYGWALCNGQTLPISQNQALFSLLGTTYGGNGTSTFQLPDLQGRMPLHAGSGLGLPTYQVGEKGGNASVTLQQGQMPMHTHQATFTPSGSSSLQVNVAIQAGNGIAPATAPATPYLAAVSSTPFGSHAGVNLYASGPGTGTPATLGGVSATVSGSSGGGTVANAMAGNSLPVEIEPPYLAVYFIIALQGIFPTRG